MAAPADSPDMREERIAVGRMVKKVLERAVKNRGSPEFEEVPLNEPASSVRAVQDECEDVDMMDVDEVSLAPSQPRNSPYDSRRIEDPFADDESIEIILNYGSEEPAQVPAAPPKALPTPAPQRISSATAVKNIIGAFPAPPKMVIQRHGMAGEGPSGLSVFNESIVEVKEYAPGKADDKPSSDNGQPVFYIQGPGAPIAKDTNPILLDVPTLNTFATNSTLISTPAPLTPAPQDSTRPTTILDVDALWATLQRQEIHPVKQPSGPKVVNFQHFEFRPTRPLNIKRKTRQPKKPTPQARRLAGPFTALDKLVGMYGVPMEVDG